MLKNGRPISLLNIDYKIIPKAIAGRLKNIPPKSVSSGQGAYIKN